MVPFQKMYMTTMKLFTNFIVICRDTNVLRLLNLLYVGID